MVKGKYEGRWRVKPANDPRITLSWKIPINFDFQAAGVVLVHGLFFNHFCLQGSAECQPIGTAIYPDRIPFVKLAGKQL